MAVIEELIRTEEDGKISFGNHQLSDKAKKEDFESSGDIYKVKTYGALTKLEKNGMFLYESVPGTSVTGFAETENGVSFTVSGSEDAQITVGLQDDTEYDVSVGGAEIGRMKTNMGGKLVVSLELTDDEEKAVTITRA
ncbi:MAG: endosialidase [Lachnospiraceae bacterium]|nr:endosialidase [Lachnospiraceae bacterium]